MFRPPDRAWLVVVLMTVVGCGPGFAPIDAGPTDSTEDDGSNIDMTTDVDDDGSDAADVLEEDIEVEPFCGDGEVDGDEVCDPGASVECTTTCDSTGTEECADDCSAVLSCLPPEEVCNDADDDCDGSDDNGLTDCRCTTEDPWDHEECNGIDDDCNESVDDGLDACRCTDEPAWDHEECNGVDDDCNGSIDDGLVDCRCTTEDPWDHEECNDIDDDCDGEVDEGLTDCRCTTDDPLVDELCNHIDDDCDGTIDDGLTDCGCMDGGDPSSEVCDSIDNDCDESIDEENTHVSPPGVCLGFGAPCVPADEECSSTLCIGDEFETYCSAPCDPSAPDPPCTSPDYRCYDDPDIGDTDMCRRNYDACARETDCAMGETCTVQLTDDESNLVTECRPALNTTGLDEDCGAGLQCGNDICYQSTYCSEVCYEDSDCGDIGTWACVWSYHWVSSVPGYVSQCHYRCGDDADCTRGTTINACQPGATSPAAYQGVGYCGTLSSSGVATGEDCDHTTDPPVTCDHRICNDGGTGVCTEACIDDGDCQLSGWTCVDSSVTFGGFIGSVPMRVCDPP